MPVFRNTKLVEAIKSKRLEQVVKQLEKGQSATQKSGGETPLYIASRIGELPIVRALVEHGANVNEPSETSSYNKVPILVASEKGHTEVVNYLLDHGADPNASSFGGTPLFYACKNNNLALVIVLLEHGADINKPTQYNQVPLLEAIKMEHMNLVKYLLEQGANANLHYDEEPLFLYAIKNNKVLLAMLLLEHGADVNEVSMNGEFPLSIAVTKNELPLVISLLERGADPNQTLPTGETPLFLACASTIPYPKLVKLLTVLLQHPTLNLSAPIQGKTIRQHAQGGRFSAKVNEFILDQTSTWKGWTQSNATIFDSVFEDAQANNYSVCPVCLKYSIRTDGCMYMHHNCSTNPGYYNLELYQKYKTPEGNIYWCTICNRIALGHKHYALGLANGPVPQLKPSTGPFDTDCRGRNFGGGLPEKLVRFRRLREMAYELQSEVGKKSTTTVMNELVKAMWDAPLTSSNANTIARIQTEKRWNIPSTNFPVALPTQEENEDLPNIVRPKANAENPTLQPVRHENQPNASNFGDTKPVVVQFRHRMQNGTINTHEGEYIGTDSLANFIERSLPNWGTEEFGMCWNYAGGCSARLYPEEVKPFIPEDLYEKYKLLFNKKFKTGGRRKTLKRRHRGGNLFHPATNVKCYLPSTKTARTERRRKGMTEN